MLEYFKRPASERVPEYADKGNLPPSHDTGPGILTAKVESLWRYVTKYEFQTVENYTQNLILSTVDLVI